MFQRIRMWFWRVFLSKEERWERLDKLALSNATTYRSMLARLPKAEVTEYLESTKVFGDKQEDVTAEWRDAMESTFSHGTGFLLLDWESKTARHVPIDEVIDTPDGYKWKPGQEHEQPAAPARKKHRPGVFERPAMNRQARRKADAAARSKKSKAE